MKKIIGFASLVTIIMLSACSSKPAEVKKEVIIVPAAPVVVKDPAVPTTIIVDKNGVKVVAKKIDVTLKKQ